jgi:hypothetical protein
MYVIKSHVCSKLQVHLPVRVSDAILVCTSVGAVLL